MTERSKRKMTTTMTMTGSGSMGSGIGSVGGPGEIEVASIGGRINLTVISGDIDRAGQTQVLVVLVELECTPRLLEGYVMILLFI